MTRQLLATFALLLWIDSASAVRVIEQIERPVELTLDELNFSAGGSVVSFSECATCGSSTHRVTDSTVYKVNGRTLPLADFLSVIGEIRQRPGADGKTFAVVFLDLESGRVTRLEIREPAR